MAFYGQILGLTLGRYEAEWRVAFYWLGAWGEAMLGLWKSLLDKYCLNISPSSAK